MPDEIDIRVTRIGVACVDSNNEPADAKAIWEKLDKARKSLNLENSIHLISLAIPEELDALYFRCPMLTPPRLIYRFV